MNKELLQQALDALKYHTAQTRPIMQTDVAMAALYAALAQPVQPSVSDEEVIAAYANFNCQQLPSVIDLRRALNDFAETRNNRNAQPKREWIGLTEEEYYWCNDELWPMIRVAELLKEKNNGL